MDDHPDWEVSTRTDEPDTIRVYACTNYGDDPAYLSRSEAIEMADELLEAAGVRTRYEIDPTVNEDSSAFARAMAEHNDEERFKRLLDRSSFGTSGAKAAMATVSDEQAARVLARVEALRNEKAERRRAVFEVMDLEAELEQQERRHQ